MMKHTAILLSGGTGERLGRRTPKQYLRVGGQLMITRALAPLLASRHIDGVCIVAAQMWREEILADIPASLLDTGRIVGFADPGSNRQRSILNGMRMLMHRAEEADTTDGTGKLETVLVHDAARPCLTGELLDAIYAAYPGHEGVIPVLPMKDMIYARSADGRLEKPLDRERVVAGQAPELFAFRPYYQANLALLPAAEEGTGGMKPAVSIDEIRGSTEPALLAGMDMITIPGDERNFKVTTEEDLSRLISVVDEGVDDGGGR